MIGRIQIHPRVFRVMKINKLFPQSTHNMANTFTMSLSWITTGIQMLKVTQQQTHLDTLHTLAQYKLNIIHIFFGYLCSPVFPNGLKTSAQPLSERLSTNIAGWYNTWLCCCCHLQQQPEHYECIKNVAVVIEKSIPNLPQWSGQPLCVSAWAVSGGCSGLESLIWT